MGIVIFLVKALMFLIALFMILLVLIQRGKGGGLAGALGGMGGQSAFGTKAGDVFTRVTIVVAAIWILLCAAAVKLFRPLPLEQQVATSIQAEPAPAATQPSPQATAGETAPAATAPTATPPAASSPAASPTGTAK